MTATLDTRSRLSRLEEARRQTQRQLDLVDRQIIRRMTMLIPKLVPSRLTYRRGKPPDPEAFLQRYRAQLATLIAERQPEIDALARRLARQDWAIAALRQRMGGNSADAKGSPSYGQSGTRDDGGGARMDDWTRAAFD